MEKNKNKRQLPHPHLRLVTLDEDITREHEDRQQRLKQILKTLELVMEIEREIKER